MWSSCSTIVFETVPQKTSRNVWCCDIHIRTKPMDYYVASVFLNRRLRSSKTRQRSAKAVFVEIPRTARHISLYICVPIPWRDALRVFRFVFNSYYCRNQAGPRHGGGGGCGPVASSDAGYPERDGNDFVFLVLLTRTVAHGFVSKPFAVPEVDDANANGRAWPSVPPFSLTPEH